MVTAADFDKLVELCGGWPDKFGEDQIKHGLSLLAVLRRERTIDEVIFGMVVRYAAHRAAYDQLTCSIIEEDFEATATTYLSGKEQSRAFHENKLLTLERELLRTPYARAKGGLSIQSSFLDELTAPSPTDDGGGKVTPFKPLSRSRAKG